MNERQRDLFLWQWSRRRQPGQAKIALRGAFIGALGGLMFAFMLSGDIGGGNHSTASVLASFKQIGLLLGLSIPAFAWIGFSGANRVYSGQEAIYQTLLRAGARVPDQKPVLKASDRGPAIAVGVTVAVIAGFIVFLYIKFG